MEELLSGAVVQSSELLFDSYSPSRTKCRVILLVIYIYIAGFDSISDLIAWGSFLKVGFDHPLLPTPMLWSITWGVFAVAGLILALLSTSHEVIKMFHFKGSFCKSHVELMPLVGLLLEDVPMLVLTSLYGLSQYTCSTRDIIESSDALVPILISSIGTALATFWRLILTLVTFKKVNGNLSKQNRASVSNLSRDEMKDGKVIEEVETCFQDRKSNTQLQSKFKQQQKQQAKHSCDYASKTRCDRMEKSSKFSKNHGGIQSHSECSQQQLQKCVCSWRCFAECGYKTFLFIFGLAICLLSVLVVVAVTYLMVQQNPHFIHRPHDPLVIFAPSSSESTNPIPLTNVSDVTENERVSLIFDEHCLIVFQYREKLHKIVYNFADILKNETEFEYESGDGSKMMCVEGMLAIECRNKLSNLFYGSYKDGSSSDGVRGSVEVFHETCLAVYVVWPQIQATPEWNKDLVVKCM